MGALDVICGLGLERGWASTDALPRNRHPLPTTADRATRPRGRRRGEHRRASAESSPVADHELGYGEVETDMLQRLEAIHSRTPETVNQEIWGLLIAYNLVRLEMERVADEVGVAPMRASSVLRYG